MKNTFKVSAMAAAVLAFASVGAFAATNAAVTLNATVPTTDAITCAASASFGAAVAAGTPATTSAACTVLDNDANGDTLTISIADSTKALTGLIATNVLDFSTLQVYSSGSSTNGGTDINSVYTPLSTTAFTGFTAGQAGLDLRYVSRER